MSKYFVNLYDCDEIAEVLGDRGTALVYLCQRCASAHEDLLSWDSAGTGDDSEVCELCDAFQSAVYQLDFLGSLAGRVAPPCNTGQTPIAGEY